MLFLIMLSRFLLFKPKVYFIVTKLLIVGYLVRKMFNKHAWKIKYKNIGVLQYSVLAY